MVEPKKVLLITNAATDAEIKQISNAISRAETQGILINLNLVHVISPLPTCFFTIPSMAENISLLYGEAKETLNYVGNMLHVAQERQWLVTGNFRNETLRLANKLKMHFILAGSHCIQNLHKPFSFVQEANSPWIQSISHAALS